MLLRLHFLHERGRSEIGYLSWILLAISPLFSTLQPSSNVLSDDLGITNTLFDAFLQVSIT